MGRYFEAGMLDYLERECALTVPESQNGSANV